MAFVFLEPGVLIDRDLELVAPDEKWIDQVLLSCAHPLSRGDHHCDHTTRQSLLDFLRIAPGGHQPANGPDRVPTYHFWMRLRPEFEPIVPMAGGLNLRIGNTHDLQMYFGHVGYGVYPPARGNHYAERACRLLFPLARAHGLRTVWITTNPDNFPSRRTCERLGGLLIETVDVPASNILHQRGERKKCRYRVEL